MENLPINILERVFFWLNTRDSKSLSQTCLILRQVGIRKIWSYARLKLSSENSKFKPLRSWREINKFPIKRLYAGDIQDFDTLDFASLHRALKEVYVDIPLMDEKSILNMQRATRISFYFYTDAVLKSMNTIPNIADLLKNVANLKILSGSNICCCDDEGFTIETLTQFQSINFSKLDITNLREIEEKDKHRLLAILLSMEIEELLMSRIKLSTSDLDFSKSDIHYLKNLNITEISDFLLYPNPYNSMDVEQPWLELLEIKTLKRMFFSSGTFISLYQLKKFNFYAFCIIGGYTIHTSDIVAIYETLQYNFFNGYYVGDEQFYCEFDIGPNWVFNMYRDVVIYLK